jgi:hypothetical protein
MEAPEPVLPHAPLLELQPPELPVRRLLGLRVRRATLSSQHHSMVEDYCACDVLARRQSTTCSTSFRRRPASVLQG